jgi:putative membrane protein
MRFVYWGLTLIVAVVCAVFALFNRDPVLVNFWPFPQIELGLYLVVLGALLGGLLLGLMIGWVGHLGVRRERGRLARQAKRLEADLDRPKEPAPPGSSLKS